MTDSKIHTEQTRLATYGTLAPGEVNNNQMKGMAGVWSKGTMRGRLINSGWGINHGFPGLIPDSEGSDVPCHIFESFDLPDHWSRLDEFEGEGYFRTSIMVQTDDGDKECSAYLVREDFAPLDARKENR